MGAVLPARTLNTLLKLCSTVWYKLKLALASVKMEFLPLVDISNYQEVQEEKTLEVGVTL